MKQADIFEQRRTGVLLHITSLPSGNMGADAYRFVDFLEASGVSVWQMLPLGPTHDDRSPYQCLSAHAGNNLLICRDKLRAEPWIEPKTLNDPKMSRLLANAYRQFEARADEVEKQAFRDFCLQQQYWLDDYVLYREIRHLHQSRAWFDWPVELRNRDLEAIKKISAERESALTIRQFEQFIFYRQWHQLRSYANDKGVKLFGDMPIFVAHDSADVWAEPDLFTLDKQGQPTRVAGVPPDYFSETGQRWGNPLYEWHKHIEQNFDWWRRRLQTQLELFDLIRIDHFRGFESCWEIPVDCETAIEGKWVVAPGEQLFDRLLEVFGELPLVAEDLGIITEQVTALREKYGMPGMKILQFAFGGDASNPYLPHQQCEDSVTYTGTHDNNTTLGWYEALEPHVKEHMHAYMGETSEPMPWLLIRSALRSVSELAVVPLQDVLSLNADHRMNVPGTVEGNWGWQFNWDMVSDDIPAKIKNLNALYGRV
ncbi:4-alpha-glucanotransferase [Methylophaga sp.]|uniref:4-alpha-glucanotransferase n=1 Tax=Methylophaga sp. TaxID=2024840 RepID=UPI003F699C80